MDDDNDGVYEEFATGVSSTSIVKTGLSAGSTYRFRLRARNAVGLSAYSDVFTIVTATVPSQPSSPITTVNSEYEIGISWSLPADLGGLSISSYRLEIKTSIGTFAQDLANCDAENSSSVISSRSCAIPTTVLRAGPFNIGDSEPIIVRVTAINDIGESTVSAESSDTSMPIADTEPNPPTNFLKNDVDTTKTQVAFTWSAPANDGGNTVIDYAIEMDENNDGVYS